MPLLVEEVAQKHTVNDVLRDVMITSFAFVTALQLRELIVSASLFLAPGTKRDQIIFNLFVALVLFLITIVMVIVWT